jgi:hypothetical protein
MADLSADDMEAADALFALATQDKVPVHARSTSVARDGSEDKFSTPHGTARSSSLQITGTSRWRNLINLGHGRM